MSDVCEKCGCPEGVDGHDVLYRQMDEIKAAAEKDLKDMRHFQGKFIEADHELRALKENPDFTFKMYTKVALEMARYPSAQYPIPLLGLGGEAGEVAEALVQALMVCASTGKVLEEYKKMIRDKGGVQTQEMKDRLIKELGDNLWYINALGREIGTDLETIARTNVKKLLDRKARGTLSGEGSER